jgi:hypothetical protein
MFVMEMSDGLPFLHYLRIMRHPYVAPQTGLPDTGLILPGVGRGLLKL